jgi:hypothetical protein
MRPSVATAEASVGRARTAFSAVARAELDPPATNSLSSSSVKQSHPRLPHLDRGFLSPPRSYATQSARTAGIGVEIGTAEKPIYLIRPMLPGCHRGNVNCYVSGGKGR